MAVELYSVSLNKTYTEGSYLHNLEITQTNFLDHQNLVRENFSKEFMNILDKNVYKPIIAINRIDSRF